MDCNRSWELMMKKFDRDISPESEKELIEHINLCDSCKTKFDALDLAFENIGFLQEQAPQNIETQVMHRIKHERFKESKGFLPFVVSPMIFFLLVVSYLLYKALSMGPIAFMDQVAKVLTIGYKIFQTTLAVLQRLLNTFYIKQAIIVLILAAVAYGIYKLARNRKKNVEGDLLWRVSK